MQSRQDELRDELIAILGAGRELTPDVDHQLADAFLRALNRAGEMDRKQSVAPERFHQPHYSLRLAGGAWGAALMFLLCALVWARPSADQFMGVAVVLLTLVAIGARIFLYLARHDFQVPHLRLVSPSARSTEDH